MKDRSLRAIALCAVLVLVLAACGSSRKSSNDNTGGGNNNTGGNGAYQIDVSNCPAGNETAGVSGDTISLGISLPQSGLYAPFDAIRKGAQSYFEYINGQGGIEVPKGSGKKYKIRLVAKDDAYDAAKTVANVNSFINDNNVFALFDVVGTKNNLGARDAVEGACMPNLLIASGAVQWGNTKFPFMLGSELVPYPLEVRTFVDYLKQNKPNAKIAVLKANDDFGQSYADTLQQLVKGTNLSIVATQGYDPESSDVKAQVTALAATKADAFLLGATLLACPNALNAMGDAGWKPTVYMSGTCVSKVLLSAAGKNANDVLTVTPLLDPADPANDASPAMSLYKQQVKAHGQGADVTDGIVAFGWTQGALVAHILESSPKLDRVSVMDTARNLKDVTGIGLQLPNSTWDTSANDWFLGETFQFIQYDATAGHSKPLGPLTNLDGKTAELSPQVLLTQ
jgi:branched-chain amino acid transport system substrate-binding protein